MDVSPEYRGFLTYLNLQKSPSDGAFPLSSSCRGSQANFSLLMSPSNLQKGDLGFNNLKNLAE